MSVPPPVRGIVSYIFCADAGGIADWCVRVLGFTERGRWPDEQGVVGNVELSVGDNEVWLDGPVPDWRDRTGGLPAWVGFFIDDVDAMYRHVVDMGQTVDPPVDREFGIRQLTVMDPEGHEWGFIRRID